MKQIAETFKASKDKDIKGKIKLKVDAKDGKTSGEAEISQEGSWELKAGGSEKGFHVEGKANYDIDDRNVLFGGVKANTDKRKEFLFFIGGSRTW